MFSIGDFARLSGVSVRTLRYYEEVDLLAPAAVDVSTGYRSYQAGQLPRLHRIVALKELGLSLTQLRPLLDDLNAEALTGMLQRKQAELEDRMALERQRLLRVERRLRAIEREESGQMPPDVVLKHVPKIRAAAIRCQPGVGEFDDVPALVEPALYRLFEAVSGPTKASGPLFIHYETGPGDELAPVAAVDIGDQPLPAGEGIVELVLPAITAATTVYEGPVDHDIVGPIYGELAVWADEHGYDPRGPGRDLIISPPNEQGTAVFELQLPISARS
ncbi:MAG TPA: MerR family transcriptional regulator [Acidimicrobiales bacterium]|nr:MerR family transcriptional regulator [Acidimicrobiales bacterium]